MRGNPGWQERRRNGFRSIPAYAGEPLRAARCGRSLPVYPRVCGGTVSRSRSVMMKEGLSPRMRGNRHHRTRRLLRVGSIPAYAGEPPPMSAKPSLIRVYPRVCGGTTASSENISFVGGLSPRMRGNRRADGEYRQRARSIPAYAGEPSEGSRNWRTARVYPRVCGGTFYGANPDDRANGLSPRMRGNLAAGVRN